MKTIILVLALILGLSSSVWAAVQTDTHTYIVSENDNAVLAINRQTGQETIIKVGKEPKSMVIHEDKGYVVSKGSNNVSVIDLTSNTVIQTIPVGSEHRYMVIHGDVGYVARATGNVTVIDLKTNTVTQTIPAGELPRFMVIHEEKGYVVNYWSHTVTVIDLHSNTVTQTIPVGRAPLSIVIYGGMGYLVNESSHNISVIDLTSNTVIQAIPVGENPQSMVIHGDKGYVVSEGSNNVSVIDLTSNTVIQAIPVGRRPRSMVIHEGMGYVVNFQSEYDSVIDLQTKRVVTTFRNIDNDTIDFSDTHIYLGLKKSRPLYPTLASINLAKAQGTLGEFAAIMPEVFKLGEIEKRAFPKEENVFDTVPPYALAQEIFWDLKTDKPLMDPKDILATLVTMKYPQRFLKTEAGAWLRKRLHMAFFQTVWLGDKNKAKTMLNYFVQLQDPVITKLATYHFKMGAKEEGSFKDALDEAPVKGKTSTTKSAVKKKNNKKK